MSFCIKLLSKTICPSVIYPVKSGIGWVISSLGIVKIGIKVTEPSASLIIPALSYNDAKSEYKYPG